MEKVISPFLFNRMKCDENVRTYGMNRSIYSYDIIMISL